MNVLTSVVQKVGRRLLRDFAEVEQLQVSSKGAGDFVSQADLRAEEQLRTELTRARPGWAVLGEEGGVSGAEEWEWRWIIDPLDGTTNFLHGIPHWCISVGVERRVAPDRTEIVAGCIYNPAGNELFWAEKGMGAFLNDKRLRVSGRREMTNALFATGIPFAKVQRKAEFTATLARLMPQVAGIRRFGSAALDLAWVAAGRYDGYWELGIHPWDMAAGIILVREAGGTVTDPEGGDTFFATGDIVAGNAPLHPKLREAVAEGIQAVADRTRAASS
jgi:myo-inositol-1(or 4)-monophosphatase